MDGVAASDLPDLFEQAFRRQSGATADIYAMQSVARMLSRKLAYHFDVIGWPETREEVLVYVREAIERYG